MATDYSPETRQDRITKQWVAFAPARSERPDRTGPLSDSDASPPDSDAPVEGCPFCPGHDEMLPSVLWQLDADGTVPWRTRAVPNKFPALTPEASPPRAEEDPLYRARPSRGRQEVIVDTPHHHRGFPRFSAAEMEALLRTYQARYRALRRADDDFYPVVFRNHGAAAGASIDHPHSQVVALAFDPPRLRHEEAAARKRHDDLGRCPYCAMIEAEVETETRLVQATDNFVAFVPYAAPVPYEVWVFPRRHEPEFGRMTGAERADLARVLPSLFSRLHTCLDDPAYNFFVRTALTYESGAAHLHWSLRLRPRLSIDAGLELGTGVQVNPSIPERDAAVLRGSD